MYLSYTLEPAAALISTLVYATCLFCNHALGANEVIESFPVGRRLAFDAKRGRLWVVCRRCERWNLSPFDERWEAVEQSERLFRDAKKRVASDNIGLARLDEGLELVRIGEPLRPEFAAWRYGDQFGRRRRRAILTGTAVGVAIGGIVLGGAAAGIATGGGYWMYQLVEGLIKAYRRRRLIAHVPTEHGGRLVVRGAHLSKTTLAPDATSDLGWSLHVAHTAGVRTLTDHHALHAAALLMPAVNRSGAGKRHVDAAVKRIEAYRDSAEFMTAAAREVPSPWSRASRRRKGIAGLPLDTRLAIEMAVNEENERIALEGELALLELAWKDAEEIAAIADTLAIPQDVERRFEELRRGAGR